MDSAPRVSCSALAQKRVHNRYNYSVIIINNFIFLLNHSSTPEEWDKVETHNIVRILYTVRTILQFH